MRKNKLRKLLNEGHPTLGTHMHSSWPNMVQVVGHTDLFDYVEFQAEYAPFDLYALENFCWAAELYDLGTMIKVDQEPNRFLAQRAVSAGFQGVLFADSRSVDDARACIQAVRPDTPEEGGFAGMGMRRHSYMEHASTPRYVEALRDTVVVLMIEKGPAVDQLEEILSLEGLDMIQWGPGDYSMSIGRPGEGSTPEVKAVERQVIESSMKMGVPPRVEVDSLDEAQYYLDLGVRYFCVGTDIKIVHEWLKDRGEAFRKAIGDT